MLDAIMIYLSGKEQTRKIPDLTDVYQTIVIN